MEEVDNQAKTPEDEDSRDELEEMVEPQENAEPSSEDMETPPVNIESEQPIPYVIPPLQEEGTEDLQVDATPSDSEPPEPPEIVESKMRMFFRRFIRWTAGLLIVFGIGLIVGIFGLYRPAVKQAESSANRLTAEINSANETIQDLKDQISGLESQISDLEPYRDKNAELLVEQKLLNLHIAILDARVDVTAASLAIKNEDPAQARVFLNKTVKTLDLIGSLLEADKREVVTDMKTRLDLVMGDIENDPETAQSDLEVLGTKLLQLEDSLLSK